MLISLNIVIFFAFFILSLTGFGHALIAMPLLIPIIGLTTAAPLVALASVVGTLAMLVYYYQHIRLRSVWRFIVASLIGIPLGVWLLKSIDNRIGMGVLAVLVIIYSVYSLMNLRLPQTKRLIWAYIFGLTTGILSGAYNTGGPPAVIYGTSNRWEPNEFRGNLRGISISNSIIVVAAHAVSHNLTPAVWMYFLYSLPALLIGTAAGILLAPRIPPRVFHKLVLVLLLALGIQLLFQTIN
ncbi:MAG: sulfite exporter TauE/SafE family protein [Anaerolineaceae bacterium]|nr:sulfite exporter TauE/SafE family protein [Anaerolineaceae bacterium]